MKRKTNLFLSILLFTIIASSCKKDNGTSNPSYTVPTTYAFANFNPATTNILLAMADQIGAKINLANTIPGTAVSAQDLRNMFNNTGNLFNDSALKLNASGLSLAAYCPTTITADLLNYFDSIGVYSQSTVAASAGVAGVSASSVTPSKKYLLSPNGVFYSQVVKKAIMGLCAYEITNVFLTDSTSNSVDNSTVVTGSGTAMEHHWDEAFGFFGVPVDFPTNKTGLRYFGSYSNQVDAGLGSNSVIMNAFLKGRAAISAKDLNTKQAQASLLINAFDSLDAAAIVQEMKETDENIEAQDAVAAYGTMSEALGFIRNLKYPAKRIITDAQYMQLLQLVDPVNPNSPNIYAFIGANVNTTAAIEAKTDAIRQFIGKIYGFTPAQLSAQ